MVVVNLNELEVGVRGPGLESSVQLGRHKLLAPQLVRTRCQTGIGLSSCGGFRFDLLVSQCSFPPSLGTYHIPKSGFRNESSRCRTFSTFSSVSCCFPPRRCFHIEQLRASPEFLHQPDRSVGGHQRLAFAFRLCLCLRHFTSGGREVIVLKSSDEAAVGKARDWSFPNKPIPVSRIGK